MQQHFPQLQTNLLGNLYPLPGILGSQILRTGSAPPPASKDDPTPPTLRQCNALLHVWNKPNKLQVKDNVD
jgi:hypothetical protein